MFLILLDGYLRVKSMGHMVTPYWAPGEPPDAFSKRLYHFAFSWTMYEVSNFSTFSPILVPFYLKNYGILIDVMLASHCFSLYGGARPWWLMTLSTFSRPYCPPVCLLWRNVCSNPLPVFKLSYSSFLLLSCNIFWSIDPYLIYVL